MGNETLKIALNLNTLAEAYHIQGKYNDAERVYLRALHMYKAASNTGGDHNTATILSNLGQHYDEIGDYESAKDFYEEVKDFYDQALATRQLVTPMQPSVVAAIVNNLSNLAGIYHKWGEYNAAKKLFEEARNHLQGADTLEAVQYNVNYARLLMDQSRNHQGYVRVQIAYERALEVNRKLLGHGHPQVAALLNNQAELYRTWGKYELAQHLYMQAKKIYQEKAWSTYPAYANVMSNYAVLLYYKQENIPAHKYFKEVMEMYERLQLYQRGTGQSYYRVADVLSNYANFAASVQDYGKAIERYQEALNIYLYHLGRGYERAFIVLNQYINILRANNKNTVETDEFVMKFYSHALALYKQKLGEQHSLISSILDSYITFLLQSGYTDEADRLEKETANMSLNRNVTH